jgi:hypothetical protein
MKTAADVRCSTFAIGLVHASGERGVSGDPAMAAHLAVCARCRGHAAALEALDLQRPPLPVLRPAPPARWRWVPAAAAGLALAAAALIYVTHAPDTGDGRYVGVKGMPSVELLIHRDGDTFVWNGSAPIHPGDALALRVACEGLSHVSVATAGARGDSWAKVKDVDCPSGPSATLPFTLLVDEEPVNERFAVVVSRRPLDETALGAAAAASARTVDVWTVNFDLAKSTEVPR